MSSLVEAANRGEVTALLIRCGYRVYRPEADYDGEDLVLRTPDGSLIAVQLKSRVWINRPKYGNRKLWMLFPDRPFDGGVRDWFLIEHDVLFDYMEERHRSAPTWAEVWSVRSPSRHLRAFLNPFHICLRQGD